MIEHIVDILWQNKVALLYNDKEIHAMSDQPIEISDIEEQFNVKVEKEKKEHWHYYISLT